MKDWDINLNSFPPGANSLVLEDVGKNYTVILKERPDLLAVYSS